VVTHGGVEAVGRRHVVEVRLAQVARGDAVTVVERLTVETVVVAAQLAALKIYIVTRELKLVRNNSSNIIDVFHKVSDTYKVDQTLKDIFMKNSMFLPCLQS